MKRIIYSITISLLILLSFISCASTDFKRIHKEVVEVDESTDGAESLPFSDIEDGYTSNADTSYSNLSPLYGNGSIVTKEENEETQQSFETSKETKNTFQRVYDTKNEEINRGEEGKNYYPLNILIFAIGGLIILVIIVFVIIRLEKKKKRKNKDSHSNKKAQKESTEYGGYVKKVLDEMDEEKEEQIEEEDEGKSVDIDEIIDIIK